MREETARQQYRATLEDVSDVFKSFDEDLEVFKILRRSAIPNMNFILKSCNRWVNKCFVEAVKVVNEFSEDHVNLCGFRSTINR